MAGDTNGAEEARSAQGAQAADNAQEKQQAEVSGGSGGGGAGGTDYEWAIGERDARIAELGAHRRADRGGGMTHGELDRIQEELYRHPGPRVPEGRVLDSAQLAALDGPRGPQREGDHDSEVLRLGPGRLQA